MAETKRGVPLMESRELSAREIEILEQPLYRKSLTPPMGDTCPMSDKQQIVDATLKGALAAVANKLRELPKISKLDGSKWIDATHIELLIARLESFE